MKNKAVFKDFGDYWSYAKHLTMNQRDVIMGGMQEVQRDELVNSFKNGGWEDLIIRDETNCVIDKMKEEMGIDLLANRCKIISGKSVIMKASEWKYVQDVFSSYRVEHTYYILGKIKSQSIDEDKVLLVEDK